MAKVKKSSALRLGSGVILNFNISQHSRDTELMSSLMQYLACGRIQKRKDKEAVAFEVNKFEDIKTKIIPFFQEYPIEGHKKANYLYFCKIALLMENKLHLTSGGLGEIIDIKNSMNK
jgi:hypothetical protein